MGRGRQKAKQTKVARELKYYTPPTDIKALEQELAHTKRSDVAVDDREDDDKYSSWRNED
ncbi:DUF3073 domain-containing protein [Sanguibacter sp. A247]|uniref:DUF3073 domain-containing protein n=1 Tax=unclassified Sanguibacter TaxID=2645534 RepID=UPI003FD82FDC